MGGGGDGEEGGVTGPGINAWSAFQTQLGKYSLTRHHSLCPTAGPERRRSLRHGVRRVMKARDLGRTSESEASENQATSSLRILKIESGAKELNLPFAGMGKRIKYINSAGLRQFMSYLLRGKLPRSNTPHITWER